MLHTIKYSIRTVVRNRAACFWLILFPMILGTLFKIAFSNLGVPLERIPVAVVTAEDAGEPYTEAFRMAAKELEEKEVLDLVYCKKAEALGLLEKGEIDGILTVGERVSLSVSAKAYSDRKSMNQNILRTGFSDEVMNYGTYRTCIGMQLLFFIAFFAVYLVASRQRELKRAG